MVAGAQPLPEGARQSTERYLDLPYNIALRSDYETGGWTARVEELPGCEARGDNAEQALRRLRGAMERWVAEALKRSQQIPEPRVLSEHSGRLLLRMPPALHGELARAAEADGISLNHFITTALASVVGWRNPAAEPRRGSLTGGGAHPAAATDTTPARVPRARSAMLTANLVVLSVLAALAFVLLLVAWYQR
jgi:predicted RNase H-like HicB family nuclease